MVSRVEGYHWKMQNLHLQLQWDSFARLQSPVANSNNYSLLAQDAIYSKNVPGFIWLPAEYHISSSCKVIIFQEMVTYASTGYWYFKNARKKLAIIAYPSLTTYH